MEKILSTGKRRILIIVMHLVVWLFFFCWPWLLFHGEMFEFERFYTRYLIFPILALVIFYVNYNRWIPEYFFNHRISLFLLCNLVLLVVCLAVMQLWHENIDEFLYGPSVRKRPPGPDFHWFFIFRNFLNLAMILAVALVIRLTGRWYRLEINRQALANQKNLAELKNLKSQLHPHFLFNTLNNIYALIGMEPAKAQEAVYDLGGLLRYVLKESEQERVPLKDEVAFIQNYISLMRLRINAEKTHLRVELPGEDFIGNCRIPPLLYISLIENAFKHGLGHGESLVEIILRPDTEHKRLRFICRNSVGAKESGKLLQEDTGVGLPNLRKRLEYIYGDNCFFEVEEKDGIFTAKLDTPLDFD